jgi:hypothetical protein
LGVYDSPCDGCPVVFVRFSLRIHHRASQNKIKGNTTAKDSKAEQPYMSHVINELLQDGVATDNHMHGGSEGALQSWDDKPRQQYARNQGPWSVDQGCISRGQAEL